MNGALEEPASRLDLETVQLEVVWNAPIGIALVDQRLQVVRFNRALAGLHGLRSRAWPGMSLAEVFPAEEATRELLWRIQQVLATGRPFPWLELEWGRVSCHPLHEGLEVVGLCLYVEEVPEPKLAREALQVSEERLRMSLASASIGTWDYNPATGEFLCDSRTQALFGAPPDLRMDCERFFSIIHPEDRERTRQLVQRAESPESGGGYETEYRVIGIQDGVERWLSAQGRAWFDEQGQLLRFSGTVLDITHRKRAEASARFLSEASRLLAERLDRAEEILERVARLAASSICTYCIIGVARADGRLPRVAAAHREPSQEHLVQAALRFVPQAPGTSPLLEGVHTGKSALIREFTQEVRQRYAVSPEHLALMNTLDAHSVMTVPMRAGGKVHGMMILAACAPRRRFDDQDLSLAEELAHRVGMSLENLRLYEEARQAVGLRDEFLSVASHELKTPLTSLKLQHALIAKSLTPECRASLGARLPKAMRQVERLTTLVDSLLDVSRIGAGRLGLEPIEMELTGLLREVMERLSEVFAQAGCRVDFPATPPVHGYWDPLRLDQVLVNLLSNAAKYGAGKPIHVRVAVEGEWTRLTVRDEGIGIAPGDLPRLFSRFGRAVSERHYGGLGLGLFISKQIVEAMQGSIRVESEPSRGSTFTVELPLCPPA
ncbi:PAS domain S-box-containing protein [Archangium gephyra]|uniref:histidine kinase n=1 Tax=Archangium gephyra TaxID=48 RepID=A0AAC8TAY7_9BACT|nr:ATP-binding protein [Archangium gephyra]AKI99356.1 sensory box histidine kinase [Archangium gephyra]REG28097.1 PAS domain S-box-containing protein [Archangium gephyra]